MNKEPYHFEPTQMAYQGVIAYKFVSVGKRGNFTKIVAFQPYLQNIYNLALLDYDESLQTIDDEHITDNGDMSKVLATTWKIMLHFLESFPDKAVAIQGNSETRQKLYHRLISNNLLVLMQHYDVLGVFNTGITEQFDTIQDYFMIIIKPSMI
jgi:hypothetical protein